MTNNLYVLFRVDTDQYIRQKALETYISLNKGEEVNTEAFEYYEFEGNIFVFRILSLIPRHRYTSFFSAEGVV